MAHSDWRDQIGVIPVMLRTWAAARAAEQNPLPLIHAKAQPVTTSPEFAGACDSLFTLAEAVLGRSLVPQCCCSTTLSPDEAALLILLRCEPTERSVQLGRAVVHGLPEALSHAVIAVRRALADRDEAKPPQAEIPPPTRRAFDNGALNRAAA